MTASKAIWTWYYASAAPAPPPPPPPPCPPLPTRYTVVTFDVPNPEVSYSGGLRADDWTVDGLYLLSSDGSNWYYCAEDPNQVLTLNVLDTSVSRYNRIRPKKAGPLTITLHGSMGSTATVGADVDAWPDLFQFNDWIDLGGQCGEVITHVTFSRRTAELWAIDDVEFGTAP